ncbi:MAG: hypothetical protein M0Q93_10700, partial [Terrimicrobiaceae bacterium]|nr:hypothetical protein [Terrimicrobiaceae bacterium]
ALFALFLSWSAIVWNRVCFGMAAWNRDPLKLAIIGKWASGVSAVAKTVPLELIMPIAPRLFVFWQQSRGV